MAKDINVEIQKLEKIKQEIEQINKLKESMEYIEVVSQRLYKYLAENKLLQPSKFYYIPENPDTIDYIEGAL